MDYGVGIFTTQLPKNDPRTPAERYRETVELTKVAEEAGFDSVWVSQHHRSGDNYLSSPFTVCAAIAAATSRIRIGVGVALAPFYEPLQLAEDAAAVDALSDGRFELGLAVGYHDPEFEQFGIPKSERVPRLIDCVKVCRRAWADDETFSYDGNVFSYEDAKVNPNPPQGVDLPILLGGFVEPAVRRAANLGDGYLASSVSTEEELRGIVEWIEAEGVNTDEYPVHLFRDGMIADDREAAWKQLREGLVYVNDIYANWFAESSDFEDAAEPEDPEAAFRVRSVFGDAKDITEELESYRKVTGTAGDVVVRLEFPTMDYEEAEAAIERFGDEVING